MTHSDASKHPLHSTLQKAAKHQPRKRFGQNFLHDDSIISQIVDSIGLNRDDNLVEIGPGMGALTEPLLEQVDAMTVIELDRDLASSLRIRIGANSHPNFHIVNTNAMQFDYSTLYNKEGEGAETKKLRIVGNLPYNISTPLLFTLLDYSDIIEDMHFMLQKEVVDRITASPNTKEYGRLSVMIQYFCKPTFLFEVPPGSFNPPPKVTSAVFRLEPYANKPIVAKNEKALARLVSHVFTQRRKTLRNSLKGMLVENGFENAGVDPMARPETLTLAQFVALSDQMVA